MEEDYHVEVLSDENSARINEAIINDTGVYTCIAASIAGTVQKSFNVFVMGK